MIDSSVRGSSRGARCVMCGARVDLETETVVHLSESIFAHEDCTHSAAGGSGSAAKRMLLQATASSLCRPARSPGALRRG